MTSHSELGWVRQKQKQSSRMDFQYRTLGPSRHALLAGGLLGHGTSAEMSGCQFETDWGRSNLVGFVFCSEEESGQHG